MNRFGTAVVLVALALLPRAALAQASCEEGRVRSASTDGHCCWPGQRWRFEACVGVPSCPVGRMLDASGADCVPDTRVVAPARATTAAVSAECHDGRVTNERTGGRCCWPSQSWSDERGRCIGPPTCPTGFNAEGDDCERAAGEAQQMSSEEIIARGRLADIERRNAERHQQLERIPYNGGPIPPGYHTERNDHGMTTIGGVLFAVGWAPSIALGVVGSISSNTRQRALQFAYIPVVGMFAAAAACSMPNNLACGLGGGGMTALWASATVDLTAQLVGVVLMLVGASRRSYLVPTRTVYSVHPTGDGIAIVW